MSANSNSSNSSTQNEKQLLTCLEILESGKGVLRALIEITLLRIPSNLERNVLEALQRYKEGPATKRYCRIITNRLNSNAKHHKNKNRSSKMSDEPDPELETNLNATILQGKHVGFANTSDSDVICLNESAESYEFSPNKSKILNDLKQGLYYKKSDEEVASNQNQESTASKPQPEPEPVAKPESPKQSKVPGLRYSGESSAFRPLKVKFPLRLQDIQKTPYYQKIYQQVVAETKAHEKSKDSSIDHFLDEMTQINYPHVGFFGLL